MSIDLRYELRRFFPEKIIFSNKSNRLISRLHLGATYLYAAWGAKNTRGRIVPLNCLGSPPGFLSSYICILRIIDIEKAAHYIKNIY